MSLICVLPLQAAEQEAAPLGVPSLISEYTGSLEPKAVSLFSNLLARPLTQRAQVVSLDLAAFDSARITLRVFPDAEFTADKQNIGFTGVKTRSWTGRMANGGSVAFILNGDRISGSIATATGNYSFYPLGEGRCVVVQQNLGNLPDCAVGRVTPPPRSAASYGPPALGPNGDEPPSSTPPPTSEQGDTPTANRVRVLVAYTSSARSITSSMLGQTVQELIDLAVVESNQGYANSGVTMRMELCCLYQTAMTETTAIENDVAAFQDPSDGKADEVHAYRADYDADMCCLLVDGRDTAWCGWAFAFSYTDYNNMFQATAYSCATGSFTFAHEFGHTQGCRHNDDTSTTPFPYGHGFRNGSNWRTIMGLANNTGAQRLNYWSNPNINSPVSPFTAMGTPVNGSNFANDCRVALNVGDSTVVNHEATPASSSAPTGDTFGNDEGADKLVTGALTVGTFTAGFGSRVQFRAGTNITLTTGFRAAPGSDFRARLAGPLGDPLPTGDIPPESHQ